MEDGLRPSGPSSLETSTVRDIQAIFEYRQTDFEVLQRVAEQHQNGPILVTLGIANYRLGKFQEAIEKLQRSLQYSFHDFPENTPGTDSLSTRYYFSYTGVDEAWSASHNGIEYLLPHIKLKHRERFENPATFAFLALSYLKIGNDEQANQYREQFEELMKFLLKIKYFDSREDSELEDFAREIDEAFR